MNVIQEVAKASIKGQVTSTNLLAALRATTKPLKTQGLINWAPGLKGPAALPRWNNMLVYFLTFKNGQQVSWGKELPAARHRQVAEVRPLAPAHRARATKGRRCRPSVVLGGIAVRLYRPFG